MLKYLKRHPVKRLTIGGGIGKLTKLAQGAMDLHSARSQVDFAVLAHRFNRPELAEAGTMLRAHELVGQELAQVVADEARARAAQALRGAGTEVDVVVIDRAGAVLARSGP